MKRGTLKFYLAVVSVGAFFIPFTFAVISTRNLLSIGERNPDVRFQLYTNEQKSRYMLKRNHESVRGSTFDPNNPTKILIHGYSPTGAQANDSPPVQIRLMIRDALLKLGDFNVIFVDWSRDAGPLYAQAVANARAAGAVVARMVKFLANETGLRAEDVHIVGISLGAHVAGYAGKRINSLGRITGLDPAGPDFYHVSSEVRLDYTDALFVDVIHTDGGRNLLQGLGLIEPLGHVDFYPNGGKRQIGCTPTSSRDSAIGLVFNATTERLGFTCDHVRSLFYFLESIDNSKCKFLAVKCGSYQDFQEGKCPPEENAVQEMGYHAKRTEGIPPLTKFFLRTNPESPFCLENSINL